MDGLCVYLIIPPAFAAQGVPFSSAPFFTQGATSFRISVILSMLFEPTLY